MSLFNQPNKESSNETKIEDRGIKRKLSSRSFQDQGIKRKLNNRSFQTKYEAILEVEKGLKSKAEISKEFGVPSSSLSTWVKNADKIKSNIFESEIDPNRKKMRRSQYQNVEDCLLNWILSARDLNIHVSGPILKCKANDFASLLGETSFSCSNGWVDRFKRRYNLVFKRDYSKAKPMDDNPDKIIDWSEELQSLLSEFSADNIFCAEETGLFYCVLPKDTNKYKGLDCGKGTLSEDRMTVLVSANISGTEKLPLLVIGNSSLCQQSENVETLSTHYKVNSTSWMTSAIFAEWLVALDNKFDKAHRKVLLIVEKCAIHSYPKSLKAIVLAPLLPNIGNKTKLMEQGLLQSFKVNYRKLLIQRQLISDNITDKSLDVSQVMQMLNKAWSNVDPSTIANCYRQAGYVKCTDVKVEEAGGNADDTTDEDDKSLVIIRSVLNVPLEEYASIDANLKTRPDSTEEGIVVDIVAKQVPRSESVESDGAEPADTVECPSNTEAMEAIEILERWITMTEGTSHLCSAIVKLKQGVNTVELQTVAVGVSPKAEDNL